jgi:dihydroneopterin aldolase
MKPSYNFEMNPNTPSFISTIHLEHLEIDCIIGDLPKERLQTQKIYLDVSFQLSVSPTDNLEDTIDYCEVIEHCKTVAIEGKFRLIETLGYALLHSLHQKFIKIQSLNILIKKPQPLLGLNYTSVEIRSENG